MNLKIFKDLKVLGGKGKSAVFTDTLVHKPHVDLSLEAQAHKKKSVFQSCAVPKMTCLNTTSGCNKHCI